MGYNTTVVVLNDALGAIAEDPEFGRRLAEAIGGLRQGERSVVPAKGKRCIHCNAAEVIETHHASHDVTVIVGGNTGRVAK